MTALMNECPTRVRTGSPPCSTISSGKAREVIRLCTTAEPGCLVELPDRDHRRRSPTAATPRDPTRRPRSSGRRRRRRPGRHRPARPTTLAARSSEIGRVDRVRLVVRERTRRARNTAVQPRTANRRTPGATSPAIPLPASITTRSGALRAAVDQEAQVRRVVDQQIAPLDPTWHGHRLRWASSSAARSRIRVQPGAQTDRRGTGATECDAVPPGRVVAGGEHRARQAQPARSA